MAGRNFVLRGVPLKWPLPKMRWGPDPEYHTLLVREMQRHSITHKWHLDRTSITKKQIFKTQVFKSNQIFQTLRNCAHGDVMYSKYILQISVLYYLTSMLMNTIFRFPEYVKQLWKNYMYIYFKTICTTDS